ncbi:MAG TPA: TPM domain-containing protein, partial [Rhizomicrobium sp.]
GTLVMAKLSATDHRRLAKTVDAVRAGTVARFELLTVPVSDHYALYPVAFGAFAALAAGGLIAVLRPLLPADDAFGVAAAVFVVVSLLLEWPRFKLMVVPKRLKHEQARQFAHRAFAARILAAHERKVGMVLFVSLGERYVELVTDDALDRKIGQPRWNAIVADCAAAARNGRLADALVPAIEACGRELAQHFPKRS